MMSCFKTDVQTVWFTLRIEVKYKLIYGDLGKRVLASIIDSLVLGLMGAMIGILIFAFGYIARPLLLLSPFISVIYFVVMEGSGWHATLGKRAMGIYVADYNGNGITYSTAILRVIGKFLSSLIMGIGYLIAFFNPQKQCLHDMLAKTYILEGKADLQKSAYTPELVCVTGPLAGMIYDVPQSGLLIGRDTVSCQVIIPASQAKVSRAHCFLTYNHMSKMFVLNDRNSSHGTFTANGRRILYNQPAALRRGDRFYIATPENSFEVR